jgi:hypothetical protein
MRLLRCSGLIQTLSQMKASRPLPRGSRKQTNQPTTLRQQPTNPLHTKLELPNNHKYHPIKAIFKRNQTSHTPITQ